MSETSRGLEFGRRNESHTDLKVAALLELERIQTRHGDTWLVEFQITAPSAKNASGDVVLSETLYMSGTVKEMLGFVREQLSKEAIISSYKLIEIGAHRIPNTLLES